MTRRVRAAPGPYSASGSGQAPARKPHGDDHPPRDGAHPPGQRVLPLPISSLKSASPVLKNPLNRSRAVTLTVDQFKYGWANALSDEEAQELYDSYHVAAPGVALMQMANANLNPWTEAKLDPANPNRGPLLIIDGEKDHTVPWAIANRSEERRVGKE